MCGILFMSFFLIFDDDLFVFVVKVDFFVSIILDLIFFFVFYMDLLEFFNMFFVFGFFSSNVIEGLKN